ncbi:MAG: 3-phosphoshikimate 1-carboxyvinyltransferase [Spirochaetes bacterium]|nr:3-phosphoshikimate 1-carboxyvinyltransferase [Spirochaetota bacterium]
MQFKISQSNISGTVSIPGSKSHTIRACFFATLAKGKSIIKNPLDSQDGRSALQACSLLGAQIKTMADGYEIRGTGGKITVPENVIDVGNSGTTLRIALSTAALVDGYTIFTGDQQIRKRPVGPILEALNNLGAETVSTRNNGSVPVIIKGRAKGGETQLDGLSSQFLSSLLINAPLFEQDTVISLTRLNEIPYVDITLWWLDKLGIKYENKDYKKFVIPGGQSYTAFDQIIPGDFSSATFFAVLAAISKGCITLKNLDISDPQGDKEVLNILTKMGTKIDILDNGEITITGNTLQGGAFDLNAIPDSLPALAVAACFAETETKLYNVPQARVKETDRIAVMTQELTKMGANIEEFEDSMLIKPAPLKASHVNGHHDHRVVMALSLAGLMLPGETTIETAEAAGVTFPNFHKLIKQCQGNIELIG